MQRNKKAFTLIELLVCITIVSIVSVAVYSIFANGISAWRRSNENKTYARNIRLTSEKMARELRNVFEFSMIAFEGTEDSVMFPALIPGKPNDEGDYPDTYYEVGRIAYFYDKKKTALCREDKAFFEFIDEEEVGKGKALIQDVSALEISYCYLDNVTGAYKWKNDWKKEEQESIPQALKIEINFKKGAVHKDKFSRVVFIPIGTGEQKITLGSIITD
jgi:prepilin-type N-terminal cleavage/methylation domain-containing protein